MAFKFAVIVAVASADEAKVGECGNSQGHCEEVCCWNGHDLVFCCSYDYPLCNIPEGVCYANGFERDMAAAVQGMTPELVVPAEIAV